MNGKVETTLPPGVCVSWEERNNEYDAILGDEAIVKAQWEDMDKLAYLYLWFVLTQF